MHIFEGNPWEIAGREAGAIGPLIYSECMKNISGIFVDESVKTPYCGPVYDIPIDKRSSLVFADISDLFDMLEEIRQYPEVRFLKFGELK